MDTVEDLISEFLTGLGVGGGSGLGRQTKQPVLFTLHTGEHEGNSGSSDDTQVGEDEGTHPRVFLLLLLHTSQMFLELNAK